MVITDFVETLIQKKVTTLLTAVALVILLMGNASMKTFAVYFPSETGAETSGESVETDAESPETGAESVESVESPETSAESVERIPKTRTTEAVIPRPLS